MDNTEYFKKKLLKIINKNLNGFTIDFNLKPIEKKKGFFVGITNNSNKDFNKAINNLLSIKEKMFKNCKNLYIGGWLDNETKTYFLDLSIYLNNKQDSLNIARLFNQKAIFDIKNLNCINA
uniref:Uncharacterized protein n=1 Tax=candidate division CPR3 bacterium TaxID=2268181 RepID=A0A7C5UT15_UNCC3